MHLITQSQLTDTIINDIGMNTIVLRMIWRRGGVGGGKSLNKEERRHRVEFRAAVTCTCTHKSPIFHYKA